MGNRSKYVVASAGAAALATRALVRSRWRGRFASATKEIAETIMPSVVEETPSVRSFAVDDESHAPGHEHLARPATGPALPKPNDERPFAKHQRGLRHPGRR